MPTRPFDTGRLADPDLLRALREGDPAALDELIGLLWAALVRYASGILPSSADPQDVVQDAFVRLWARRTRLREDGSLKALLYTSVRNACLDEVRASRRRDRFQNPEHGPPPPSTPYEDVHGAELHRLAAAAVTALPAKRQEVFRMVREEGLSYREVAEILDLSEQTVANHMSLAMADLRTALRPHLRGEEGNPASRSDSGYRSRSRSG